MIHPTEGTSSCRSASPTCELGTAPVLSLVSADETLVEFMLGSTVAALVAALVEGGFDLVRFLPHLAASLVITFHARAVALVANRGGRWPAMAQMA